MSGQPDTESDFRTVAQAARAVVAGTLLAMPPGMLGVIRSCALFGIEAFPVDVEVDIAAGLPTYHVVGLPATSVREGAVRIRSALEHAGSGLPKKKITVNLAPAGRRKEGAAFDLPIAVAVLLANGPDELAAEGGEAPPAQEPEPEVAADHPFADLMMLGELGLDGTLRPVRGALSAALLAHRMGLRGIVLPPASALEAAVLDDLQVYTARHIAEVIAALRGKRQLERMGPDQCRVVPARPVPDMSDVRGQIEARGAVEVAVAGGHNIMLSGPPGTGKTMLARRIPGILPPLSRAETLETTQIYSAVGMTRGLVTVRPFRAPHHSVSAAGLLGGGSCPRPGEISLAHNGVLFLDEMPEFNRAVLESLRQPLEDRQVTIGRVRGTVTLPASFLLVASANPCPCGWHGANGRTCTCSPTAVMRYRSRLSGPLMDRIDLHVFVNNLSITELRAAEAGEPSAAIRERVVAARQRQLRRLAEHGCRTNAEMNAAVMRRTCRLDASAELALARLHKSRCQITARGVDRIIKVAQTIADLNGRDHIDRDCIFEAIGFRSVENAPAFDVRQVMPSRPPGVPESVAPK